MSPFIKGGKEIKEIVEQYKSGVKKVERTSGYVYDWGILLVVLLLAATGMLMVYSTSSMYALDKFGTMHYFLKRHALYLGLGLGVMFVLMRVDYHILGKLVYPTYVLALGGLVAVFIPGIGKEVGEAKRWISLGPFGFQPAEFAKLSLILYLAYSLTKKKEKMGSFLIGFLSHVMAGGIYAVFIMLQPDFGTSVMVLTVLGFMLFIGGARLKYLAFAGVLSLLFFVFGVLTQPYRLKRILSFFNPWDDPQGSGYQAIQSFIAFGLGGVTGGGLGSSLQKLLFLPEAHTDFIFSIIGEELGLLGVLSVVACFVFFAVRGFRVSMRAPDLFGCYLAFGCTVLITFQAGVNMAVTVGLFPTKGLTLPFISYGGTSLVASLAAAGILLNVSRARIK